MSNKCICVLCYKYGSVNHLTIRKLKEDIQKSGNDTDLWLLYNIEDTNNRREEYKKFIEEGYNVWTFKFRDIQKKYPMNFFLKQHIALKPTTDYSYGNLEWPLLEFFQNLPYKYYMFYEDDSIYTGNINQLYKQALQEKHDIYFLSQFNVRDAYTGWIWAKDAIFYIPTEYIKKFNKLYAHIVNMYIISRENCQVMLDTIIKYEWMGMHEWLLPSLCKFLEWDICFLQDKLINCCQDYLPINIQTKINNLTKEQMKNSWFHPVKDLITYNKII